MSNKLTKLVLNLYPLKLAITVIWKFHKPIHAMFLFESSKIWSSCVSGLGN